MGFEIRRLINIFEKIYEMFYDAEKSIMEEISNKLFLLELAYFQILCL